MIDYDVYYRLAGSCVGCRRVSWLCRRNQRCSRYSKKIKKGDAPYPTGFEPRGSKRCKALDEPQEKGEG